MNYSKLVALLFALALPAAVLAQGNDAAKPNPDVEKAIIKIEHDMSAALTKPDADAAAKTPLAEANREYERRFNRIFIVCATSKSAVEILEILRRRLKNGAETELHEAAEQQRQITELRLKKWLQR